jgi:Bacterial HORMA domain family 1
MTKYTPAALFHTKEWDMQYGYSSDLTDQPIKKDVIKYPDQRYSIKNESNILSSFEQTKTSQNWLNALFLNRIACRNMNKITANCVPNKVFPLQNIQHVVERMIQDLKLITDQPDIRSIYQITKLQIAQYCHDIKILAESGYLQCVDICLLDHDRHREHRIEHRAYRFEMDAVVGKRTTNRPNSVFISNNDKTQPALKIVLKYNAHYTRAAQLDLEKQLCADWQAAYCDIRHSPLSADIDRDYICHGFRIQRTVFC